MDLSRWEALFGSTDGALSRDKLYSLDTEKEKLEKRVSGAPPVRTSYTRFFRRDALIVLLWGVYTGSWFKMWVSRLEPHLTVVASNRSKPEKWEGISALPNWPLGDVFRAFEWGRGWGLRLCLARLGRRFGGCLANRNGLAFPVEID